MFDVLFSTHTFLAMVTIFLTACGDDISFKRKKHFPCKMLVNRVTKTTHARLVKVCVHNCIYYLILRANHVAIFSYKSFTSHLNDIAFE
jgi:hypothetical protein